jgi:acetylornithine/N-succinyldiaminopimelate aminotransferase
VLDVVLAPGFLDRVRRTAILFKQRLAELKDRHPAVIAEVRGEGLLLGLRVVTPNAELVDALRAEKLLTAAAGENVVRLLPPLIIGEAEIADAMAMIDRACTRIAQANDRSRQDGVEG